ncbi:MAG: fumarylacetoacetate hydrolase family protein, partial [Pseudomonadota bacterium]
MKLLSYTLDGRPSYGVEVPGGLLDLGRRLGAEWPTLKRLIAAGELGRVQALLQTPADTRREDVVLLPVLPDPGTIVCIGLNYEEHRAETARPVAPHPTVFLRIAESLQAHDAPLLIPRESTRFDYEGELALVIGKAGRRIAERDAWDHIAGVSCFNDGSVRDWQSHTHQFGPGKNFPLTGAFGPALDTPDELPADRVLQLHTRVNGRVVQQA